LDWIYIGSFVGFRKSKIWVPLGEAKGAKDQVEGLHESTSIESKLSQSQFNACRS